MLSEFMDRFFLVSVHKGIVARLESSRARLAIIENQGAPTTLVGMAGFSIEHNETLELYRRPLFSLGLVR